MIIGVTGCPGSGKSMFAASLADEGWRLIDADMLGRELVESDKALLDDLAGAFGQDILGADGRLDRRLLAKRAFSDRERTAVLNGIVHPRLIKCLADEIEECRSNNGDAVIDCALIFEWGIASQFDAVVCVVAAKDLRIRRIAARDGRSSDEIEDMFSAQLAEEEKAHRADVVIRNEGSAGRLRSYGRMFASLKL